MKTIKSIPSIETYLKEHEQKELLRFITCGSVDDGKSTLIGRLLYESKAIFADQLAALKSEAKYKRTDDSIDFSLLIDGLQAEREQGITIDVAYRYFSTDKRKFIIADTPGHEQYTRNMATGASNADLAVILIDARNGVLTQTKRHTFIAVLLGIRQIIVAINKMDLVDYKQEVYEKIRSDYLEMLNAIEKTVSRTGNDSSGNIKNPKSITQNSIFIPISALKSDNVVKKSVNMPWYKGKTLLEYLNTVEINQTGSQIALSSAKEHSSNPDLNASFRFPVQYVNRPNSDFRGYCGTIASGSIKIGDEITVLPSRIKTHIKAIIPPAYKEPNSKHKMPAIEQTDFAYAPMAVTLLTEDEVDITRGDMIVKSGNLPETGDCFDAYIVWMNKEPLKPGRIYDIKRASTLLTGYVGEIYHKINVNTLEKEKTGLLKLNEIGLCKVTLSEKIAFDRYDQNRYLGSFIIIDKLTNNTVGAGIILNRPISSSKSNDTKKCYTQAEIELNVYIRKHYPEWGAKDISR